MLSDCVAPGERYTALPFWVVYPPTVTVSPRRRRRKRRRRRTERRTKTPTTQKTLRPTPPLTAATERRTQVPYKRLSATMTACRPSEGVWGSAICGDPDLYLSAEGSLWYAEIKHSVISLFSCSFSLSRSFMQQVARTKGRTGRSRRRLVVFKRSVHQLWLLRK